MSNPSGTVYLQANQTYVWQDGDVYQIPQGDTTEGAAQGASFSGLGVDNQPHQFLLNKINWLKRNQATATSNVGVNGWYKISSQDANLGQIQIIEQWGTIPAGGITIFGNQAQITFSFPLTFTTVCWSLMPYLIQSTASTSDTPVIMPIGPFKLQTNTLFLVGGVGYTQTLFNNTTYGIGWRALGY